MLPSDIRAAISQFLALLDGDACGTVNDEEALSFLLDQLAFAQHFVRFTFDETDYPDSPRHNQAELRKMVAQRFPNYGYYNVPEWVTKEIAESTCIVGDAIDDILDIANDLLNVDWRWANNSESDALWYFQESYSSHWQSHLRGLQGYILSRHLETIEGG